MSFPGHIATAFSDAGANGGGFGGVPSPSGGILGPPVDPSVTGPADRDAFTDLHLDQIVTGILGRTDDPMAPLFHTPLPTVAAIEFRHAIFRDLEKPAVAAAVKEFTSHMRSLGRYATDIGNLRGRYAAEGAFLEAVHSYTDAVASFATALGDLDLASEGLKDLRSHVNRYVASERFTSLVSETEAITGDLATVRYTMAINGRRVRVGRYRGEPDYGEDVEKTFARFSPGESKRYTNRLGTRTDIGHVEERILELVARLFPAVFGALDAYVDRNRSFVDPTLIQFARDIRFYLSVLTFMEPLQRAGLPFCYPSITGPPGAVRVVEGYDLALAARLIRSRTAVVTNDFTLAGDERIVVVTGPNQGGKTTFARMFGQMHHLAAIGCPVPGRAVSLPLVDGIFTHFEREEHVENLRGKLADDLTRVRSMFETATPDSLLIMNETLNSTTLTDARFLGERLLERVAEIGARCIYVTFVDELASFDDRIVSMVGGVDPEGAAVRTYKIARRPADGRAYAVAIAERYGLTYEQLKGRLEC